MNDKQQETLSALMDGELDEMSLHRLFSSKSGEGINDADMLETWSRYHLARDAMKGDINAFSAIDLSQSISAAIEEEASLDDGSVKQNVSHWWKPVAGLSVAASVAFAVVLGARFDGSSDFTSQAELASESSQVPALIEDGAALQLANQQIEDEVKLKEAQDRLNSYLRQHAQDSAIGQGRTSMPFARVVNFETQDAPPSVRPSVKPE